MAILTEAKKLKYLAADGQICPYCGSQDFDATGDEQAEGSEYIRGMECYTCGQTWTDVFRLVSVRNDVDMQGRELEE